MPKSERRSALGGVQEAVKTLVEEAKEQQAAKGRDRGWEAGHKKTSYRIPLELRDRVKAIAKKEGVTADDVCRKALERFCEAYDRGEIEIPKYHRTGAYTWFLPESEG